MCLFEGDVVCILHLFITSTVARYTLAYEHDVQLLEVAANDAHEKYVDTLSKNMPQSGLFYNTYHVWRYNYYNAPDGEFKIIYKIDRKIFQNRFVSKVGKDYI